MLDPRFREDETWRRAAIGKALRVEAKTTRLRLMQQSASLPKEAGIDVNRPFLSLTAMCMVPVVNVCGFKWGDDVLVIPEFAFAVDVGGTDLSISDEHIAHDWATYDDALARLHWDSNKTALWELNYRLTHPRSSYARSLFGVFSFMGKTIVPDEDGPVNYLNPIAAGN